ncbi:MAG: hypothetical protein ABFC84_02460 [Veillonellales bacterium]
MQTVIVGVIVVLALGYMAYLGWCRITGKDVCQCGSGTCPGGEICHCKSSKLPE